MTSTDMLTKEQMQQEIVKKLASSIEVRENGN
jgi:hypothetical protein